MKQDDKLRIDKYLWAIRIFKTRGQATDACKAGKIKVDNNSIKPSYIVRVGEVYSVQKEHEKRIIKVIDFLYKRVDAKLAVTYYEDLTPKSDMPNHHSVFTIPVFKRKRGTGRPTKKERREMDQLRQSDVDE